MSLSSKLPALGVLRARPTLAVALVAGFLAACGESTTAPAATETLTPEAPSAAIYSTTGLRALRYTQVCAGQVCTFDASVSTGFTTYRWSFGDGTPSSSLKTVVHTYPANGSFMLSLMGKTSTGISATVRKIVTCTNGLCF
jgi:hypothetical protein